MAVFARRAKCGEPPLAAPAKDVPDAAWSERYLREYRRIVGPHADLEATEHALRYGMDGATFSVHKSRLERRLRAALGPAAVRYRIDDGGTRPRRYRLALDPDAVGFESDVAFKEDAQ